LSSSKRNDPDRRPVATASALSAEDPHRLLYVADELPHLERGALRDLLLKSDDRIDVLAVAQQQLHRRADHERAGDQKERQEECAPDPAPAG
jgi:hypothetical protein